MTKRDALIEDAKRAGYTVEAHEGRLDIFKLDGRTGNFSKGIRIHEDGTCNRLDIDLAVATNLRTYADRRAALSL